MKYTIVINQLTWQTICPDADFRHAILLEAIKSFCNSKSEKMIRSGDGYTWVSSTALLNELPMLIAKTKSGLTPVLKDLESWGMIKIKRDENSGYKYYKVTEKAESLDREINSEHLLNKSYTPVRLNEHPRTINRTYHYTNNHNTSNPHIKREKSNPISGTTDSKSNGGKKEQEQKNVESLPTESYKPKKPRSIPLIEHSKMLKFANYYPELSNRIKETPAEEPVWLLYQVIHRRWSDKIGGKPFYKAAIAAAEYLKTTEWYEQNGGLLWLLDIGNNGYKAAVNIAKYMKSTEQPVLRIRDGMLA